MISYTTTTRPPNNDCLREKIIPYQFKETAFPNLHRKTKHVKKSKFWNNNATSAFFSPQRVWFKTIWFLKKHILDLLFCRFLYYTFRQQIDSSKLIIRTPNGPCATRKIFVSRKFIKSGQGLFRQRQGTVGNDMWHIRSWCCSSIWETSKLSEQNNDCHTFRHGLCHTTADVFGATGEYGPRFIGFHLNKYLLSALLWRYKKWFRIYSRVHGCLYHFAWCWC